MDDMLEICSKLKLSRKHFGLRQKDLAKVIDCSISKISEAEKGKGELQIWEINALRKYMVLITFPFLIVKEVLFNQSSKNGRN